MYPLVEKTEEWINKREKDGKCCVLRETEKRDVEGLEALNLSIAPSI